MKEKVLKIWPEIKWIENKELREKVLVCWVYAIENSVLTPEDLEVIPFSLLKKDCKITFMNHKRTAVQLSVDIAKLGEVLKGHEFHYSKAELHPSDDTRTVLKVLRGEGIDGKIDGLCRKNVLATYTHIHAGGNPQWAGRLLAFARKNEAPRRHA